MQHWELELQLSPASVTAGAAQGVELMHAALPAPVVTLTPASLQPAAQVLFSGGRFQWKRLENLITLAREGSGGLDLSETVASGARVVLLDERLRLFYNTSPIANNSGREPMRVDMKKVVGCSCSFLP